MKPYHLFFALIFLGLLSACGAIDIPPIEIPGLDASTATSRWSPTPAATETITHTPRPTFTPTQTLTATPTFTPLPTRTSPYPVGLGTPLPDLGFPEISPENSAQLSPVFRIVSQQVWQTAISRDSTQLFVATNQGLFVYDRQGQEVEHWPSILTHNLACTTCLSLNVDGSRFALATRQDSQWVVQVYIVHEQEGVRLLFEKPLEASFDNGSQIRLALSPDGDLLAYGVGKSDTLVVDINDGHQVLTYQGDADATIFSPDNAYFGIRRGRELLFWSTATWKNPANLLLPADDSPYVFSPDGKLLAVAVGTRIRIFTLDKLNPTREILVQPSDALSRTWELIFTDPKTLLGYGVRWDSTHTKATVDVAQWNVETGETLKLDTSESDSPNALPILWGAALPTPAPTGDVAIGRYSGFFFVSQDQILVNSVHSACWLKLSTGETLCFNDPEATLLASQSGAFRAVSKPNSSLLQSWKGDTVFQVAGPYPIIAVNKSADYILVNVNDATTDVYSKTKKLPSESLPGVLLNSAESFGQLVISTRDRSTAVTIALFDKTKGKTIYQKKDTYILKPLAIANDGSVYFVQQTPDGSKTTLKVIDPKSYAITDLAQLPPGALPQGMALSLNRTVVIGLQDGSVLIVSPDGKQVAGFQAIYTTITGISITPDGRYLAVASDEGIRIFAVLPVRK